MVVGWVGVLACLAAIGYVVVARHSVGGLRVALGCALAAVVVYITQLRPRATAYASHLTLHGSLRDTVVPYLAINQVTLGQTLNVFVGRKRYLCVGIGRSVGMEMRQRVRAQGVGQVAGASRAYEFAGRPQATRAGGHDASYAVFVHQRIEQLVAAARLERDRHLERTGVDVDVPPVRHTPARVEVVALAVTAVGFALSLLL